MHLTSLIRTLILLYSMASANEIGDFFARKTNTVLAEENRRVNGGISSCSDWSHSVSRRDTRRTLNMDVSRNPRHAFHAPLSTTNFGKALYFDGKQTLQLRLPEGTKKTRAIPRRSFTFEGWVNPEGGQIEGATIAGVYDICTTAANRRRTWSVGIHPSEENRGARVYVTLRTDRSRFEQTIWSVSAYIPAKWFHLAVIYDGRQTKLFLNGAKVASGQLQKGDLFSHSLRKCKQLFLGGDYNEGKFFRGSLDDVKLWDYPLKHKDIVLSMKHAKQNGQGLIVIDNFDTLLNWDNHTETAPLSITSDVPTQQNYASLSVPPCGRTICDDPDVINSYNSNWRLRQSKIVHYNLINIYNNDGTNPTVTARQIEVQQKALNQAFIPYNISWEMSEMKILNSSIRRRTVLLGCNPLKVGNGKCNTECEHPNTGNDGGDCDPVLVPCDSDRINNGRCDFECNKQYHSWDGGDCCDPQIVDTSKTCFDPTSPHRAFLSLTEYKEMLNITGSTHLNVYFATWIIQSLVGVATFPWDKEVFSNLGGTAVHPDNFGKDGKTDNLIHEMGHVLGLWHIHRGISEMECNDPCLEVEASMELGDLLSDTPPTPKNLKCSDPDNLSQYCGIQYFKNTLFNNYMGYADDSCTDSFTHQQMARMHCYLDLKYQSWQRGKAPSPPPLAPKIVATSSSTATLSWVASLGTRIFGNRDVCDNCLLDGTLVQYASRASTPNYNALDQYFSPNQATGAPDAEHCDLRVNSWVPENLQCSDDCYIDLYFHYSVVPSRFKLWVTWGAKTGIADVVFYLSDNTEYHHGAVTAFCDIEYTANLLFTKSTNKMRVVLNSPMVAIDAVQLYSKHSYSKCAVCKILKYQINRNPPFPHQDPLTDSPIYLDRNVERGVSYRYKVKAIIGNKKSDWSPELLYMQGEPYCGNGKVERDRGEECDDRNAADGDGCTIKCKKELFYSCRGQPSLCYRHDGDGECEDFERRSSIRDCGFYTPEGFIDQWASSASANPEFQKDQCPETVVVGSPPRSITCKEKIDPTISWFPCGHGYIEENFWLKVQFKRAVIAVALVIHFASDGITEYSTESKAISLELIDYHGNTFPLGNKDIRLKCKDNPVTVNVVHDLSTPFFKTKGALIRFRSYHIAIAAVILRSSKHLDPITIGGCRANELYNPHIGSCVAYNCKRPLCDKLNVPNGEAECTGNEDGDTCNMKCNNGYTLYPSNERVVCTNKQWNGVASVCIPVDCGLPDIHHADIKCPDDTQYGRQCNFKCTAPAKMFGTNNIIRCDADGLWSLPDAYCQVTCDAAPSVANAHLVTRSCRQRNSFTVGTKCRFKCKRGFHIQHSPPRRRTSPHVCDNDGVWIGPSCVPVECPILDLVVTGLYTCTKNRTTGSVCGLTCPGNDHISSWLECQFNGRWNGTFSACNFGNGKCPSLTNTNVIDVRCSSINIGSSCAVECKHQFHNVVIDYGPNTSKLPGNSILCTGMKKWLPNVDSLRCVEQCMSISIGDGWCDPKNNRAHCDWDGGDCCASTTEGGVVQTFSHGGVCVVGCECKDPRATEKSGSNGRIRPANHFRRRNMVDYKKQRNPVHIRG